MSSRDIDAVRPHLHLTRLNGPSRREHGDLELEVRELLSKYEFPGEDTPIIDTIRTEWSTGLSFLIAEMMPKGMPKMRLKKTAPIANSALAGKNCRRSSTTGRWVRMETPKPPWNRFFM